MVSISGCTAAFERAEECLLPESPEERCSEQCCREPEASADSNNVARSTILEARSNFMGMYDITASGRANAWAQASAFLSPDTPEDCCSLDAMESTFKLLDSELVRLECNDHQGNVIDDLWRLIKMTYNGATRQEALAALIP